MRLLLLLGLASVTACFDPHSPSENSADAAPGVDAEPGGLGVDASSGAIVETRCNGIAGARSINDELAWDGGNIVTEGPKLSFQSGGYLGSRWAFRMEGGSIQTDIVPTVTSGIAMKLLSPWEGSDLTVKVDITGVTATLRDHGTTLSTGEGDHDGAGATVVITVEANVLRVLSAPRGEAPVEIFAQPAPAWTRAAYVHFGRVDFFAGDNTPYITELEKHGPGAAPCKAEQLIDPFDALDPITWRWTEGCTPTANGMLSLPVGGGAPSSCFVRAHYAWKLRGSRASLELPSTPGVIVALRGWNPGTGASVRLALVEGELRMLSGVAAPWQVDATVSVDPTTIRWLGLREDAGDLIWETSADGTAWTQRHRARVSLDLEHLVIGLEGDDDFGAGTAMIQSFGH